MEIFSPDEKAFADVDVVGVAVATGDRCARQNHVAILYKFGSNIPKLLHLAGHEDLRSSFPNEKYLWFDLGESFDDIDRAIICAHVHKVSEANSGNSVFYGFDYEGKYLDPETGVFKSSMPAIGLTCATFFLEVLDSCGYQIIHRESWLKGQKADIKWQKKMIEVYLKGPGVPQVFLERQKKNVGNRRYLPEEVAAATQVEIPAVRGDVKMLAYGIRKKLKFRER